LQGDQGARAVIQRHQDAVLYLPVANLDCRFDIDTPEDLARAQGRSLGPAQGCWVAYSGSLSASITTRN
jgi:hypothetical protein